MITAYICSPYRAKDKQELRRNKGYAKKLTRLALDSGLAPITPHLYITKVTNENSQDDRRTGLAAGMELLHRCDVVIVGNRYGISEGMAAELKEARGCGIRIIDFELHSSAEEFIEAVHGKNRRAKCFLF